MAPKNKKKKSGNRPRTRFFVPPPMQEENNPLPDADTETGVDLVVRYATKRAKKNPDGIVDRDAVSHYAKLHIQLYTQYNQILAQRFEARYGPLDKMDRIDISDTVVDDKRIGLTHETIFSLVPNPILACTPCYSKGVLQIDPIVLMYFEILNLDLENMELQLYIHSFRRQEAYGNALEPGVAGAVSIRMYPQPDGGHKMGVKLIHPERALFFTDIYTALTPRELGWDADSVEYWQKTVVQNAANQLNRYRSHGIDPTENLGRYFAGLICVVNYVLEYGRPRLTILRDEPKSLTPQDGADPGAERTNTPAAKNPRPPAEYDPNKPKIRTVGNIRFVSQRPPRRASQTIRQYKTPAWTVRGHTRTYKSGKVAYIPPGVRKRKGLSQDPPQQSILKIKGTDVPAKNKEECYND